VALHMADVRRRGTKGEMHEFEQEMADLQVRWRGKNIDTTEEGFQNGVSRPWILPRARWEDGLWPGLRSGEKWSFADYLKVHDISRHTGSHNLKSSWVSGVNLYFPFGQSIDGRKMLAAFLASGVDKRVRSVESVELEYAEEGDLSPELLLGEQGGNRGSGQTSPDIALLVNGGKGLLLVENKLTEHSFYACSARSRSDSGRRRANPDIARCDRCSALIADISLCHHQTCGRQYWQQLQDAVNPRLFSQLPRCPAATAGYQLFRQQALAEGIAKAGRYEFVVSAVAIDARNERLVSSMKSSGINDVRDWGALFVGRSSFAVFTHQDWVAWVRTHDSRDDWRAWAQWVAARYKI